MYKSLIILFLWTNIMYAEPLLKSSLKCDKNSIETVSSVEKYKNKYRYVFKLRNTGQKILLVKSTIINKVLDDEVLFRLKPGEDTAVELISDYEPWEVTGKFSCFNSQVIEKANTNIIGAQPTYTFIMGGSCSGWIPLNLAK